MKQLVQYMIIDITNWTKMFKTFELDDRTVQLHCEGNKHTFAPGATECVCGKLSTDRIA